jgi:hypothetical protein
MQRVSYTFLHFPKKTLTKHIINQNRLERKGEEKIGLLVSAEKEGGEEGLYRCSGASVLHVNHVPSPCK